MKLEIGLPIPDGEVTVSAPEGAKVVPLHDILRGKRAVLFGVPAAFSKNCTAVHFPSFVQAEADFAQHGSDLIACVSVNDTDVMAAWKTSLAPQSGILMISDADASWSKRSGLQCDEGVFGGMRCRRFAAVVDDLVVRFICSDASGVKLTHASNVFNRFSALQLR
jgi:glutaredoxin/glutathione-dependent peroxiredoxin